MKYRAVTPKAGEVNAKLDEFGKWLVAQAPPERKVEARAAVARVNGAVIDLAEACGWIVRVEAPDARR